MFNHEKHVSIENEITFMSFGWKMWMQSKVSWLVSWKVRWRKSFQAWNKCTLSQYRKCEVSEKLSFITWKSFLTWKLVLKMKAWTSIKWSLTYQVSSENLFVVVWCVWIGFETWTRLDEISATQKEKEENIVWSQVQRRTMSKKVLVENHQVRRSKD